MKQQADQPLRIVFDAPVAFIELLYGRAALDLDVASDMPAAAPVIEHAAAPDGADERWRLLYESALDQYERHDNVTPGWLSLDDAAELNSNLARAWVREQRRRVIEDALMTTGQNGPRLNGRGQSLVGGPITHVIVLPVVGQYSARPMTQILVTSLDTFLNDAAWATAITS